MPQQHEPNPYESKTQQQQLRTTKLLNEAIGDFLDSSRDLHQHEVRVADLTFELIKPLRKIFVQTQKHTEFRRAIYSMFGASLEDDGIRQYENDHEIDQM